MSGAGAHYLQQKLFWRVQTAEEALSYASIHPADKWSIRQIRNRCDAGMKWNSGTPLINHS